MSEETSRRRERHLAARKKLLAASAHKARLQGRNTLTFPLTAAPGKGDYELVLADALRGTETPVQLT